MRTERAIEIDASAERVWAVYSDVRRWPEWTDSVTKVEPLDGDELAVGRRFRITQPKLPVMVWEVTALEPGASWRWAQRSPGARTEAWHAVDGSASHASAQLGIEQRGPVGGLVARVMAGLTRRYLDMEAEGLKARSERSGDPA